MGILFDPIKVSSSDIPVKRTDIWSTSDSGTTIVFSYATFKLERYDLNIVGSLMWRLCDGTHSVEDIASIIGKLVQYPSNEERKIIDHCIDFIQTIQDYGLVYIGDSREL